MNDKEISLLLIQISDDVRGLSGDVRSLSDSLSDFRKEIKYGLESVES